MRIRHAMIAAGLVLPAPALAQDHDPQIWTYTNVGIAVAEDTAIGLETVHRYSGNQEALYEDQYVITVQRKLANGMTVIVGYNRVYSSRNGQLVATEDRPREMIVIPVAKFGKTSLVARLRAEQRFRSDDDEDGHRVRAEYRFDTPVGSRGHVLRYMHEDYFNLNRTAFQRDGYERMRNAVSLFFPMGKAKLELGYMNQWRFNPAPRRDLIEHGGIVGISLAL